MKPKFTFVVIFLITITEWASVSVFGPLVIEITQSLALDVGVVGMTHSLFLMFSGVLSFIWAFCAFYIKLIVNLFLLVMNPSNFLLMG